MTSDNVKRVSLEFLARNAPSIEVVITNIQPRKSGPGFLVYYQDARALAGDDRFELSGNIPLLVLDDLSVDYFKEWSPYGKRP